MVYKIPEIVQEHEFSCIEDLKCDIIENVLSVAADKVCYFIYIVVEAAIARRLYTALLQADVNGFSFNLFEETTPEEVTKIMTECKYVTLSVENQGDLFVERNFYNDLDWTDTFLYIQKDAVELARKTIDERLAQTLVFTIK